MTQIRENEAREIASGPARPPAILHYLRLISVCYRTSIQADMEYRVDFFTRIIAGLLELVTTAGALSIAYHYTPTLKGWTFPQALILLSVYYLMNGLIEMFIAPNMRNIMEQVRLGTLDFVLLKPVSAQFLATFRTITVWRIANVVVGLGLCVYSVTRLSLTVGIGQAGAFAITLCAGAAIVYSFWLMLVTLTFWFVKMENIEQIVWQAFEAGRYPIEIYPSWLRGALTYGIPIAFIISVPAGALAGRTRADAAPIAVAVALGMLTLSSRFWRFGLRHYTGASS